MEFTTPERIRETVEKFGFAIVPNLLSREECTKFLSEFWRTLNNITSEWNVPIEEKDEKSWTSFYNLFPMHSMLLQHFGIGHAQFVWNLRQNPKIIECFQQIWNETDLLVSFDGVSFHLPPEKTKRGWYRQSWLHTDQRYTSNRFECIQSFVSLLETNSDDATLQVLVGSHKLHSKFAQKFKGQPQFEKNKNKDWYKLNDEEKRFYTERGCELKRIACPEGSLVLWDSRTIHCGVEPLKSRLKPNFRAIVYLCYMPRSLCSEKLLKKKRKAFEEQRMTSHWPAKVKLFPKVPRTYGKELLEIKRLKKPELNDTGKRLAGFEL